MAKPDPLNARAYQLTVSNTEKSAARTLKDIRRRVDQLNERGLQARSLPLVKRSASPRM